MAVNQRGLSCSDEPVGEERSAVRWTSVGRRRSAAGLTFVQEALLASVAVRARRTPALRPVRPRVAQRVRRAHVIEVARVFTERVVAHLVVGTVEVGGARGRGRGPRHRRHRALCRVRQADSRRKRATTTNAGTHG